MDVLTKEQRHKVMSHIRSKDTSIEVKLRKALWQKGYRYRKNYKALPGTPDIVLLKESSPFREPLKLKMPAGSGHDETDGG